MGSGASSERNRSNTAPTLYGDQFHLDNRQYNPQQMQALYLTGDRPDQGFMSRPVAPAPELTQTIEIRNDVNLKKNTLRLVQQGTKYHVTFEFDTTVPCSVNVFFMAAESIDPSTSINRYTSPIPSSSKSFPKGLGQLFDPVKSIPNHEWVDVASVSPTKLAYSEADSSNIPIVISLTAEQDGSQMSANSQSQITFLSVVKGGDETYSVNFIKQKIHFDGQNYELQEIYGIESSSKKATGEESKADDDESGDEESECVICMSSPKDTTILPCRHMCLCLDCAEELRRKASLCPICRTQVQSLLQIRVDNM